MYVVVVGKYGGEYKDNRVFMWRVYVCIVYFIQFYILYNVVFQWVNICILKDKIFEGSYEFIGFLCME